MFCSALFHEIYVSYLRDRGFIYRKLLKSVKHPNSAPLWPRCQDAFLKIQGARVQYHPWCMFAAEGSRGLALGRTS